MVLLRKEIGKRLAAYYAQTADSVVGSTSASVSMSSLWGEWHWKMKYRNLYENQNGQWLTPVELFKPFYSNAIANFVARSVENSGDGEIEVVELGGGRGTNASLMLDHLKHTQPEIYDRISYRIFDSSPSLHELQQATLEGSSHSDKIRLELVDLLAVAEGTADFLEPSDTTTVVVALELLDNLPHDKIRVRAGKIEQASVVTSDTGELVEEFTPLADKLLKNTILTAPTYKRTNVGWVPTVACGLIGRLARDRPNTRLLFADFDWLPAPDILASASASGSRRSEWASGEPLVTSMEDIDYECYLDAPILSDILFPTNFKKLSSFARNSWRNPNSQFAVQKQADFLLEYGSEEAENTKSWLTGYSPLLHDFGNCSVLSIAPALSPARRG